MYSKSKEKFTERILEMKDNQKQSHFTILTQTEYSKLIEEVQIAKLSTKKSALQRRRLQRFDVIDEVAGKKLIAKNNDEGTCYYLPINEIFDVIESAHISTNHGGRDKIRKATSKNYANVTSEMIGVFLSLCETCHLKKKRKNDTVPKLQKQSVSHGQFFVVKLQTQWDVYKFVLIYQNCGTKFIVLKPLRSVNEDEIAQNLFDIFTTFGAPCVLHSDESCEFVKNVTVELKKLWSEFVIICVKTVVDQNLCEEIQSALIEWMNDNKTTNWPHGLKLVQFAKNSSFHREINETPFKVTFGSEPILGLSSLLPIEIIDRIQDEEDLEVYLNKFEDNEENTTKISIKTECDANADAPRDAQIHENIDIKCVDVSENFIKQEIVSDVNGLSAKKDFVQHDDTECSYIENYTHRTCKHKKL